MVLQSLFSKEARNSVSEIIDENVDEPKLTHGIYFSARVTFLSSRVNTASDDKAPGSGGLGVKTKGFTFECAETKQGPHVPQSSLVLCLAFPDLVPMIGFSYLKKNRMA